MTQTMTSLMMATLLILAAGCDLSSPTATPEGARIVSVTPDIPVAIAELGGGASHVIVSNEDGSEQEEVIYLTDEAELSGAVEHVEIPQVILSALAEAPASQSNASGLPSNVSLVIESDDGSAQEEVVLTDSSATVEPTSPLPRS